MKGTFTLVAALLLSGCGHWQSGPDAPFVRWNCQSEQDIAWRYADKSRQTIDLKVGNGEQVYTLRKEPATRGAFYSDGVVAFHQKTSGSLVYRVEDNRLLAHGCNASLISI